MTTRKNNKKPNKIFRKTIKNKRNTKKTFKKKSTVRRRFTRKNRCKKGGTPPPKKQKIAILLITTHGNIDVNVKEKTHDKEINVYKINAVNAGVCNFINDEELVDMGKDLSSFINSNKNNLFNTDKQKECLLNKISKHLLKIDEVNKDTKKVVKSSTSIGPEESGYLDSNDEDCTEYIKRIGDAYSICKWKMGDEYIDKTYTIILDELKETNSNPYNNTICFLGEPGMPKIDLLKGKLPAYEFRNPREKENNEGEKESSGEEVDELTKSVENLKVDTKDKKTNDLPGSVFTNIEKTEKSNNGGSGDDSSDSEEDTNIYINMSEILTELYDKGFTDTIIIDLACAAGYDPRCGRSLRRNSDKCKTDGTSFNFGGKK